MNRGRHKKSNSKIEKTKKYLLLGYGAKNLENWKHFTLEEIKLLINETIKQQREYAQNHVISSECDLSRYENDWSLDKTQGGINWCETKEGHEAWRYMMLKLCR